LKPKCLNKKKTCFETKMFANVAQHALAGNQKTVRKSRHYNSLSYIQCGVMMTAFLLCTNNLQTKKPSL
jgi:hypothetical protein